MLYKIFKGVGFYGPHFSTSAGNKIWIWEAKSPPWNTIHITGHSKVW